MGANLEQHVGALEDLGPTAGDDGFSFRVGRIGKPGFIAGSRLHEYLHPLPAQSASAVGRNGDAAFAGIGFGGYAYGE